MKPAIHTNCDVVIVPPMEAVWLTGPAFTLHDGRGCLSFEVKGDNDATVLLKQQTGSRRWQHLAGGGAAPNGAAAAAAGRGASPVEQNYTVILGSHRNSCLKFEKDGELCCMVAHPPGAGLSGSTFTRYWINYDNGCISVGRGPPGEGLCARWTDPEPIANIRFAGLSAWDKHVGYRNLRMHPALQPPPSSPPPRQQLAQGDPAPAWPEGASQQAQHGRPQAFSFGLHKQRQEAASTVPSLVDMCQAALLCGLSAGGVCEVLLVADCLSPVVDGLRSRAVEYVAQHFQSVVSRDLPGLCSLGTGCLVDILCCESLDCPEKAVFDAVMKWAGYGREVVDDASACHPMQDLEQLLPCIRFPLMNDGELEMVRRHAMWGRSGLLRELLQEALDARSEEEAEGGQVSPRGGVAARRGAVSLLQDARHVRALTHSERLASSRFQMRRAPGCTELIYMYDGDKNGVCWHLGTCGGSQPWVNPVLAGRLQVRASSPACRSTDPRAVVGNNFARCNFAGPRMENGQPASWWVLDLGPEHQLICNCYTLRHDGSADFLRSWVLQGSNDNASWADLRRHLGDRTLCKAGQYASWPVASHAAAVPYRYFRLLQVAPNPEAANPHHVCLSYWELYGELAGGSGKSYLYQRKQQEGQQPGQQ
ncbi:hypothetical protein ABPG75_013889 [Micractinium tetrahymenae]